MAWTDQLLRRLGEFGPCGYEIHQRPAAEPTALTAWALAAHGRRNDAQAALDFLSACQTGAGEVGVRQGEPQPAWPTSLAILAWQAAGDPVFEPHIQRGSKWLLAACSDTIPRSPELGHDTTLVAWPWAAGTHAWVEPTSFAVMALKANGLSDHPRTREAVRMLLDRQLPGGGCNYGNTFVLGQKLRPHVQPTGTALAALADEREGTSRISRSVAWLANNLSAETSTASLCWGLMGLAAHGAAPQASADWLCGAYERAGGSNASSYKLALIALTLHKLK
jgi:hypothetical protein